MDVIPNETIIPEKNTVVIGSILLTNDKNSIIKPVIPEYLSTCIITDPHYKNEDIRINNVLGKLSIIIEKLEEEIKQLHDTKKLNKYKEVIVENSNSDGIVL